MTKPKALASPPHPKWGDRVSTPAPLASLAGSFDAAVYVNARHQVTAHLHAMTALPDQEAFLDRIMAQVPMASARILEDGSLIVQMSERDFCQQLEGKVLHHSSGRMF